METQVALADCQNFYVSCERVFDPALRGRPVAVLSNNDGCIIARSEEVKDRGVPMGAPYFKWRKTLEEIDAKVLSSNYELYGDMSRRVMNVLARSGTRQEVYSIDECFLEFPDLVFPETTDLAGDTRRRAWSWLGLPVRIGVGPTKTLAKITSECAKATGGVCVYPNDPNDQDRLLAEFDARDVWGIGPASEEKLRKRGVHTAKDLRDVPVRWARRRMTVVGARTVLELRGKRCLPLEGTPPNRKSMVRSRSFSKPVCDLADLEEAVATRMSRAAQKLRDEGLVARSLQVFITTKKFGKGPHYKNAAGGTLPQATNYTPTLVRAAKQYLRTIYRRGYGFKKAGVVLFDLTAEEPEQGHLFEKRDPADRDLMAAVDAINRKMGKRAVQVAAVGLKKEWSMKQDRCSPCYTTRWGDLPTVRSG